MLCDYHTACRILPLKSSFFYVEVLTTVVSSFLLSILAYVACMIYALFLRYCGKCFSVELSK